ncbi:MAG: T9SS type A sorting domain-containing protein [bacterium]
MRKVYLYLVGIVFTSVHPLSAQWITNHDALPQPEFAKPNADVYYTDPIFGTNVIRITDALNFPTPGFFPQYSKRQAWNADESRMLLFSDDGRSFLFDGNSYSYIKELPGLWGEDIFWHPTNPQQIIFASDNVLSTYDIESGQITQLREFPEYTWINTRGEGNLSRDAKYYAFVGQTYDTDTHYKDLVVYDIQQNSVVATLALPVSLTDFDWVSISTNGNYVVVDYATAETGRFEGVEVYDRNFNFIWQKPLGAGHSDLTIDASGDEVLVMDYYDENTNSIFVKKFRLADGTETNLIEFSWQFDSHISCRNEERSEWCFISTFDGEARLTHDAANWLPFEDEIFALKLDGSGDVQRIAHHHSRRFSPETPDRDNSVYWAEPHASVSCDGTRIIFGSNWSENISAVTSVDAYIVDMRSMLNEINYDPAILNRFFLFQNYPNPFNPTTTVKYSIPAAVSPSWEGNERGGLQHVTLKIYDVLGREVATLIDELKSPGVYVETLQLAQRLTGATSLTSGVYFYCIKSGMFTETKKMILLK